jgi:tryptophanyl-tRNA synthetase
MSLKDGIKKMSKSDPSDLSRINLTDNKEEILNKIKKAKTDPLTLPNDIKGLSQRPEAENLLGIYSSLKSQSLENSISEFKGKNFSEFKEKLSEILIEKIEPISKEIKRLLEDKNYLDSILLEGSNKADKIAAKKIKEMKDLVGF